MGRSPKAIQSPALCGGLAPWQHWAGVVCPLAEGEPPTSGCVGRDLLGAVGPHVPGGDRAWSTHWHLQAHQLVLGAAFPGEAGRVEGHCHQALLSHPCGLRRLDILSRDTAGNLSPGTVRAGGHSPSRA